jgi:hypothetical protein
LHRAGTICRRGRCNAALLVRVLLDAVATSRRDQAKLLFTAFEQLVDRGGLEKIKTIGDA